MTPMWVSLITAVVIRVPLAYGLAALLHSPECLYISQLISWAMGAIITAALYLSGKWRGKAVVGDAERAA